MDKNRIQGAAEQGERAKNREALVIKAKRRKSGGGAKRDEAESARDEPHDTGQVSLLAQALARGNMVKAWQRVKANKGSAGVDGRTIAETGHDLTTDWPRIRAELLAGPYRPLPVRRVTIPKAGGGQRELGISPA